MEAGAYVDLERSYPVLGPSLADPTGKGIGEDGSHSPATPSLHVDGGQEPGNEQASPSQPDWGGASLESQATLPQQAP
eukprot:12903913-Prorocentrum_lima.AAC.1